MLLCNFCWGPVQRTRKVCACVCVWEVFSPVNNNLQLFTGHFFPLPLLPKSVPACFTGDTRFPLEVRCQFELHSEALHKGCWRAERESASSLWASSLPLGYPCGELQVLKCFEKGQGDQFLEEFSFPGGPWRNFAGTLYPLSGENKCTLLCISWNCVLLTTYISSCGAVCFCVLLTPVVVVDFLPCVVWSWVAEDSVCV